MTCVCGSGILLFERKNRKPMRFKKSYFYNGNWAMQKVIHWTRSQSLYESRVLH